MTFLQTCRKQHIHQPPSAIHSKASAVACMQLLPASDVFLCIRLAGNMNMCASALRNSVTLHTLGNQFFCLLTQGHGCGGRRKSCTR